MILKQEHELFFQHFPITHLYVAEKRILLQSLMDFGGRYIYHDSHVRTDYNRICLDHMDSTMKQYITKMTCLYSSYLLCMIGPAYAMVKHGLRSTFVETRIPFTEPKSDAEFMVNSLLQSAIGTYGMITYLGLECFLSLIGKFELFN